MVRHQGVLEAEPQACLWRGMQRCSSQEHDTETCMQGIVGRIIGRGGETIRALQQASQAHIVVDQNYPEGQPRRVNISGRQDAVDRAAKMVQELISGEPGSAQSIIQKVLLPASHLVVLPRTLQIVPHNMLCAPCASRATCCCSISQVCMLTKMAVF